MWNARKIYTYIKKKRMYIKEKKNAKIQRRKER